MSQIFDDQGNVRPVTAIEVAKQVVTGVREHGTHGYSAVQVGYGERREKNIAKPQLGQWKELGNFAGVREFRVSPEERDAFKMGGTVEIAFAEGDTVEVSAVSKGKGFQGVVKRHGFHGGPRSHGQKHNERAPGSIGTAGIQKVIKGLRMAGRMGGDRVTVKNLTVVKIDRDNNLIYISGAVPGRRGTLVEIKG